MTRFREPEKRKKRPEKTRKKTEEDAREQEEEEEEEEEEERKETVPRWINEKRVARAFAIINIPPFITSADYARQNVNDYHFQSFTPGQIDLGFQ